MKRFVMRHGGLFLLLLQFSMVVWLNYMGCTNKLANAGVYLSIGVAYILGCVVGSEFIGGYYRDGINKIISDYREGKL